MTGSAARNITWGVVGVWALFQSIAVRGAVAGGWREADTQTIALNFLENGFRLFHPQIAWGGAGPGYVESELQIYPFLIASVMSVVGEAEWPGQLISLVSVAVAVLVTQAMLARRFGPAAGMAGALFLLTTPLMTRLSVAVMPDALAFAGLVIAYDAFERWRGDPRAWRMAAMAAALLLAGLIKPFLLAIGLAQVLVLLIRQRDLLRSPAFWIAWGVVAAAVAASMWHGLQLYERYGNSFGVLSGIDSKFPDLEHALRPGTYRLYVETSLRSGTLPAALALLFLIVRRRMDATALCLALAAMVALFASMRYSSTHFAGLHYHTIMLLPAAFFVAQGFRELAGIGRARSAAVGLVVLCGASYAATVWDLRREHAFRATHPTVQLAEALVDLAGPDALIVYRSGQPRMDADWGREDNFQDPTLMYSARARGWILPGDAAVEELEAARDGGAAWYVEAAPDNAALDAWLRASGAGLRHDSGSGRIWELSGRP